MVIAYHLILTAYGWWLPNDPRGSSSHKIRNDVVKELGEIHHGRKRVQPASRDIRKFYENAAEILRHPLLTFGTAERAAVAQGVAQAIQIQRYTCYACAIMQDHLHICIRKHRDTAEQMVEHVQQGSKRVLYERQLRAADHPTWGGPGWKVFLDSVDDVRRTVSYIEQNPIKAGWKEQEFEFVTAYDDWPFHKARNRQAAKQTSRLNKRF